MNAERHPELIEKLQNIIPELSQLKREYNPDRDAARTSCINLYKPKIPCMTKFDSYYLDSESSIKQFTFTPTHAFNIGRAIQGKLFWETPYRRTIRKKKTLVRPGNLIFCRESSWRCLWSIC